MIDKKGVLCNILVWNKEPQKGDNLEMSSFIFIIVDKHVGDHPGRS